MNIKYVHTNLIARDWQKLASFYIVVFGCKAKQPERDLKGKWVDSLTSLKGAHIRGIHLLLPGFDKNGPTLELFQYSTKKRTKIPQTDQPGYGHIAFSVNDVAQIIKKVTHNGVSLVGKRISATIEGVGALDVVYARDPEGNIIELQKWT
jgi:predicted enzyme related to lactoylglutathione lyase